MNASFDLRDTLDLIANNLMTYLTNFAPRALTGLVILVVGWVVGKAIQKTLEGILGRIRFDAFLERLGITEMLSRAALRDQPSRWVPRFIYYIILVLFVRIAAEAIGLEEVADAISAILAYIPSFAAALLIILFGNVIAQFAGSAVASSADNAGIEYARALGRLVSGVIVFLVVIFALAQLKIDMAIVNSVVLIVVGGFALAFALAFGMGSRGVMRNILAGFYARKMFAAGDEVEVAGERGTIRSINAIATLLDRKGTQVVIPNGVFVDAVKR